MPEPIRPHELRAAIPTLEPDEAFLAQLSARAAAGSAVGIPARPVGTWQVVLAAAGVAAVLVGVAWLGGLRPAGLPDPSPAPPMHAPTPTDAVTAEGPSAGSTPASRAESGRDARAGSTTTAGTTGSGPDPTTTPAPGSGPEPAEAPPSVHSTGLGLAYAYGHDEHPPGPRARGHSRAPDAHAEDHPAAAAQQDRPGR